MSKAKIDKKKIYLYATPLAFVFGIVFGTLFIAYVVIAQSYFNAENFVFEGGTIQNKKGADVALMIPRGTVGIGTSSPDIGYKLDIVGDINTNSITASSLTAPTVQVDTLSTNKDGQVDINGSLSVDGRVDFASTTQPVILAITDGNETISVDLRDMFYIEPGTSNKVWKDGASNFNWTLYHVYGDDRTDITDLCSGETGPGGYSYGWKVQPSEVQGESEVWVRVDCTSNPTPPCCGLGVPDGCVEGP